MFSQIKSRRPSSASSKFSSFRCDAVDTEAALTLINERDALLPFAYVVFPSATHLAGNQWQGEVFGMACDAAWLSLCSGTGFRQTARRQGIELSTLSLPDFASVLFGRVLKAGDPVNLVGATPEVAAALRTRLHLEDLAHHAAPANINESSTALAACLAFCRAHPARFTLFATETPRQEVLAAQMAASGGLTGVGLCLGEILSADAPSAPGTPTD